LPAGKKEETSFMIKMSQLPPKRTGLRWYQQILLFLMTMLGLACIGMVTLLYFGYSIPGVQVPPYLSFLLPPPTPTQTPYYTPTITPTYTSTPNWTPTPTRTVIPTNTLVPTRTKAPTWTLLPMFSTPSVTPLGPSAETGSETPTSETPTP
jgi:hypothetical protein